MQGTLALNPAMLKEIERDLLEWIPGEKWESLSKKEQKFMLLWRKHRRNDKHIADLLYYSSKSSVRSLRKRVLKKLDLP